MKKTKITIFLLTVLSLITLSGCTSMNVKSYRPDATDFVEFKSKNKHKYNVVSVSGSNTNFMLCRIALKTCLPNKMTYESYIEQALKKSLASVDKLSSEANAKKINIVLSKITLNSLGGRWIISGYVTVDNKKPIYISSVTEFGTSLDDVVACHNSTEAFPEAVTKFVKDVLNNI
jgi:hypothetical protein